MQPFTNDDVLLTADHVSEMFGGVSKMTLWRWVKDESNPFPKPIKLSSRNYWRRSALLKLIEDCEAKA